MGSGGLAMAVSLCIVGVSSCSTSADPKGRDTRNTKMEYEERQQYVGRVRQGLERDWDGSSGALRQPVIGASAERRRDVYALYWRAGTASRSPGKRSAFVEYMLIATGEETALLRGQLLKWLQDFRKEDFNQKSMGLLNSLPWSEDFCPAAIRLIGIAEVRPALPRLKAQVQNHPLPEPPPAGYQSKNTWAAWLALARLGDDAALAYVIRRVRAEEDIIVRATILFDDLGYTRRPAAFDALKSYLNSDKRLPAVKDTVPGRLEASYAAAVFSKHIKGFPIEETDFSERQTSEARLWVNAQTGWQFK
jgi:hypothetical protein